MDDLATRVTKLQDRVGELEHGWRTAKVYTGAITISLLIVLGLTWMDIPRKASAALDQEAVKQAERSALASADTANAAQGRASMLADSIGATSVDLKNLLSEAGLVRIAQGSTEPNETNWQRYSDDGIFVDVNTSSAGFTETPLYVTSLNGRIGHWIVTGSSSIYNPSPTGFRVYVRMPVARRFDPEFARSRGWYISWVGIEKVGGG